MLGQVELTITRDSEDGEFVDGYFVPAEPDPEAEPITIKASVQPFTPKELMVLPEGDRTREWVKVYTKSELFVRRDNRVEDKFSHKGNIYSVMKEVVQLHPGMSLSHRLYHCCVDNQNTVDAGVAP
jgi:hypothetical protein